MNFFSQRRQILVRDLKKDGVDGYLITHPTNVRYLTGFTGDSSFFVATAKQFILISDDRFSEQITEECPGLEIHIRPHNQTITEATAAVLTSCGLKSVGVEADHMTLGMLEAIKSSMSKANLAPIQGKIEAMRMLKDASEVESIRAAVKVAERAFAMFKATLRETDSEKDLVDAMESFVRRSGGESTPFSPIIAVGERGSLPHARPTSRPLNEGSKLLVDWGAVLNGYRSDITRTFRSPFQVAPSRRNKQERVGYDLDKLHDVVKKAQEAAIGIIRDGVAAKDVDEAARKVIRDAGYGEFFTHGLGHGIGLETHELPRIRQSSTDVLETGMVVTIEPGVYIPGWGGVRIEDDVLVRRDGAMVLTTLPRDCSALG